MTLSMKRLLVASVGLAALMVGIALAWYSVRQEREFQRLIAVGDAALAEDQTYGAIEAFSGALVLKRDSMLAYLKRGDTYRRRGELTAALRDLRDAAALDLSAPRPVEMLGDVNAAMGRYERASEHYQAFTELDDRSPRVLYKLALAYYRNGQVDEAIESLRNAVALDERFTEAHYLLGMCLRERRQDEEAMRALARAVEINPAFVAAREEMVDLFNRAGRRQEALEQLEALAALDPARAERLVSVGLAYARWGRTDAAVLTLGRAAERYPDEPAVYTALGRVWLETAELRNDRVALGKAHRSVAAHGRVRHRIRRDADAVRPGYAAVGRCARGRASAASGRWKTTGGADRISLPSGCRRAAWTLPHSPGCATPIRRACRRKRRRPGGRPAPRPPSAAPWADLKVHLCMHRGRSLLQGADL